MRTISFNSTSVLIVIASLLVLVGYSFFYLTSVWVSLSIAFVLAYLIDPLVSKLEHYGVQRPVGSLVVLGLVTLLLVTLALVVVPTLLAQGHVLLERLPKVYLGIATKLGPYSETYLGYNIFTEVDKVVGSLGDPSTLMKPAGELLQRVFSTTFRLVTTVLGLLIIPLMAYYLLRSFPKIYDRVLFLVPKRYHKLMSHFRTKLHAVLGGFIRGQLVVSTILSLYYGLALSILRVDIALILGLMAGFFNIIPYLGIATALILTLLIVFIHAGTLKTYIAILFIFAVGMGVEGSILTPRIVGKRVGLSPLVLILALLIGGELMGLVGMLIAVPVAALGKVVLDILIEAYRSSDFFKA